TDPGIDIIYVPFPRKPVGVGCKQESAAQRQAGNLQIAGAVEVEPGVFAVVAFRDGRLVLPPPADIEREFAGKAYIVLHEHTRGMIPEGRRRVVGSASAGRIAEQK